MTLAAVDRVRAVIRVELLVQSREPLTVLYMLVLGLLAAAFAAAGPVELVRNRGDVPRDAAWSVMLACTALTAFGQVITTMVAATVVLRDRTDRVSDLLHASLLTSREYLTGKLCAALLLLCVIYCAIPVGLVLGAVVSGGNVASAIESTVRPFFLLVLPTMLAVGALQFAVGVLSGRLWLIVAQGLLLIWLWSASIDGATSGRWGLSALLLDPFGSAPLLHATQRWTDVERMTQAMPITLALLLNRMAWLAVGAAAALLAIRRGSQLSLSADGSRSRRSPAARASSHAPLPRVLERRSPPSRVSAVIAVAAYVMRWMLRDAGWRVLAVLGAINVGVHVMIDVRGSATSAEATSRTTAALVMHARLFLILLATIYAGELVWRERDERSAPLFDAQPIARDVMIAGRVLGALVAQCAVVAAVTLPAVMIAIVMSQQSIDATAFLRDVMTRVAMPFMLWMLIALGVHTLVQQKVAGHLVLIAGWVLGVVFVGAASASGDTRVSWAALPVMLASLLLCWRGWVRGERSGTRWPSKWRRHTREKL